MSPMQGTAAVWRNVLSWRDGKTNVKLKSYRQEKQLLKFDCKRQINKK
jgi:hypothetical protein